MLTLCDDEPGVDRIELALEVAVRCTACFITGMELLSLAADIKATHALSVADAWNAAAALYSGTTLLNTDSEFEAIKGFAQEWLV